MDWQKRINVDPKVLVGKPVIRGTRLAVDFIVDLLAQGWSEAEIMRNYPGLQPEDIRACLHYASEILRAEKVFRRLQFQHESPCDSWQMRTSHWRQ